MTLQDGFLAQTAPLLVDVVPPIACSSWRSAA